jgi:thiol-disulfide isomerase/thioredoxin
VEKESALRVFDLENREVDPFDAPEARAIVFVFTRSDCPVSNRYAPELERLYRELAPQHVAFRLVYIDPREAVETIRGHLREYGLHLPALRDPRHAIVELAGARVTPEAAVFLPGRRLVYRGRIDNRYADIDKMRPAPTRQDLREALSAILSGTPVTPRTTDAAGCLIADVR